MFKDKKKDLVSALIIYTLFFIRRMANKAVYLFRRSYLRSFVSEYAHISFCAV